MTTTTIPTRVAALSVAPQQIIGYVAGRPVRAIAGGSGEGDGDEGGNGGTSTGTGDGGTSTTGDGDEADPAEIAKWKSLARKHEQRAKENADKAKQFDELTESQKTEAQKAIERAEKAEKRAAEAEQARWRAEVAAEKGLTPSQAKRLVGATRDELSADADEMLTDFKGSRRTADFGGGDRGKDIGGGAKQWTKADLEGKSVAEINEARKAGKLDRLMGKTS